MFERLDRASNNDLWRLLFPGAVVKVLPRLEFSDHHPILIALHGFERETYLRLLNLNVHG